MNSHVLQVSRSAGNAKRALDALGIPSTDDVPLKVSGGTFARGGHYGVEIPAINSLKQLQATINALQSEGVYCTRFNETHGSHLLTDTEVSEMLAICRENGYGMVFGLGPRPEYDIKASFYRTPFGLEMGRQLNNHVAFAYAVDEAFRLCELGCRGITVYDIGVLKVLNALRDKGDLPADLKFKTSSHCMPTNAPLAQIFGDLGADSITTAHDLSVQVLQAMRAAAPATVMDVPTDVYKTKGGYIRWFELAEIVQVASPVFLKMGASIQRDPYDAVKPEASIDRARRIAVGQQYLERNLPKGFERIRADDALVCPPVAAAPALQVVPAG